MTEQTKHDRIFLHTAKISGRNAFLGINDTRIHEDDVEYIRADIVAAHLESSKRDADEFEQVAANHINENERIYKQLSANASALKIALDALNQIYKNGTQSCRVAADLAFKAIDKELGK